MITFDVAKEKILEKNPGMKIKKCLEFTDFWLFSLVPESYLGDDLYMTGIYYPAVTKDGDIVLCNITKIPSEMWGEVKEIDV